MAKMTLSMFGKYIGLFDDTVYCRATTELHDREITEFNEFRKISESKVSHTIDRRIVMKSGFEKRESEKQTRPIDTIEGLREKFPLRPVFLYSSDWN